METRIKPHREKIAAEERREALRRFTLRRQTVGMLILAGLIVLWWLFHTDPKWIFPPGWWRL